MSDNENFKHEITHSRSESSVAADDDSGEAKKYNQEMLELQPDGDLILVVGKEQRRFLADKKTLMRTGKVWRASFGGRFVEAEQREVKLPEVDAEAMSIILKSAHGLFLDIPTTMDITTLYHVAEVVDYYDTATLVGPFFKEWIICVEKDYPYNSDTPHPYQAYIYWVFGVQSAFVQVLITLVRTAHNNDPNQANLGTLDITTMETFKWPPGVLESIVHHRESKIEEMLDLCRKHLDDGFGQNCAFNEDPCSAIMLGTYMRSLKTVQLYPIPDRATQCAFSLTELVTRLRAITISTLPVKKGKSGPGGRDHFECVAKQYNFDIAAAEKIFSTVDNPLDDSLRSHFDEVRAKLHRKRKRDEHEI